MQRAEITTQLESLIRSARRLVDANEAVAVVLVTEQLFDFAAVRKLLRGKRLVVASRDESIIAAAHADEAEIVPILHDPQTRHTQVSQVLLEAIADEILDTGDVIITLYTSFEKKTIDTISVIHLSGQLARLTSRDLQRLETQVPLETLRIVVDLACEIGREGREGRRVGTIFVVGNHRKVMSLSQEQVHDPFKGYPKPERTIRSPRVRESIKEIAQMDGAFVISSDGYVQAAGRHLRAAAENLILSKGLGSRHWAAAEISKATDAIAVAVSQSTGSVRLFQNGLVVLQIEPMRSAMKWQAVITEPEQEVSQRPE